MHQRPDKTLFKKSPFLHVGDPVLEFSGTFEFPGADKFFLTDHTGAKVKKTDNDLKSTWKWHLPLDLELTTQNYLCALMIAFPGAVRPTGSAWLLNGVASTGGSHYVSEIHESIEFLREHKAFPHIEVDVQQVIGWVFAQNGMFDAYSDTPASRALNYFTRLFDADFKNDELSVLIWALAGIEGLLVQGGRSSTGQLKEKLGAIAGRADERRNFRSNLSSRR